MYEGGKQADDNYIDLLRTFGATRMQIYTKVIAPSTVFWVLASCKLNVGFALLGAFIGEFISSDRALGHYVLRASGLYDVPQVLAGVTCIVALSLLLGAVLDVVERYALPWRQNKDGL